MLSRRRFLKWLAALSFFRSRVVDAVWPRSLFASDDFQTIFQQLFAGQTLTDSDSISLQLPENAEDGASVPMLISSELDNIDRLYVLVEKNPTPLILQAELQTNALLYLTSRIKMAESCQVWVIIRQDGQYWQTRQWVNVMKGGCGTG